MATTAQAQSPEVTSRLVRVFALAGLLKKDDLKKFSVKFGKGQKSLGEVLTSDASLSSIRDLFMYDLTQPFKKKGGSSSFSQQLAEGTTIRAAELSAMIKTHQPPVEALVAMLEKTDAVQAGALSKSLKEAKELDKDPYEWLTGNQTLTSEVISNFLNSPLNPLAPQCALVLALSVLEHNNLVDARELKSTLDAIAGQGAAAAMDEMNKLVTLSSAELIERLQDGLYLQDIDLPATELDAALFDLFPETLIRRNIFVPISTDDTRIAIATTDPINVDLSVLIRTLTGKWLHPYFAPQGFILDRINQFLGSPAQRTAADDRVETSRTTAPAPVAEAPVSAQARPAAAAREAGPADSMSAVELVTSLLENAIDLGSTDIHLEPRREDMVIRFRIDGQLTKILSITGAMVGSVTSRIKVLANMDVTERRRPQDGHINLETEDRTIDFRVASLPTVFGEKIAIRILDSARLMTGLEELGLMKAQLKVTARLIENPYGIILVTGPTGSGKTSTLYAFLNSLNEETRQLVTIEDPVEYQLDGINQTQVDLNIGFSFSDGLRAILRQDPNIIMVGEIRDKDTALTAMRAAMTGHLVFSTLHTNTAIGAVQALKNLGASSYMVGSSLVGLIAQRLVRKLCTKCKKKKAVSKALAKQLGIEHSKDLKLYRAVGCEECHNTGYSGRIGIFEVIELTDNLTQAILDEKSPAELLETADAEGRLSIQACGIDKVKAGVIAPEELVKKIILDT